jgi:hypothetical protein
MLSPELLDSIIPYDIEDDVDAAAAIGGASPRVVWSHELSAAGRRSQR